MKEIVPRDSRYIPQTQQHWCCVPTCISIIMYRHSIPLVPSEELGHHLGLLVPKDQLYLFWNAQTGPEPPGGYGTRIFEKEFYPDRAFEKLGIPLRMIFHPISGFKNADELKVFLQSVEREDKDVIACFDYGTLYSDKYSGGHATLVDRIVEKDRVRLVDPWIESAKWRTVDMEQLFKAMLAHGDEKMGGFWEFKKI